MTLQIRTNNVPRDVLDGHELTEAERADFDYIDWSAVERGEASASFFRYRGELHDLSDGFDLAPAELRERGWDGFRPDSFYSGLAVRYVDHCERVVVALVLS